MNYNSIIKDCRDENRSSMKEWILKSFFRRECTKFVPSSNNQKCGCGKLLGEHPGKNLLRTEKDNLWRIQDNTELFSTNAFGTLVFQGADIHTLKAEYIRLSFDTNPQNVIKLLKSFWKLELPKLIISIHGGIANFGIQPKLKEALYKGLKKVVETSHIWIITAGTDTGVVKHIGGILKDILPNSQHKLIVIGIAPWGVVNDRESLLGIDIEVPYYANQRTISSGHLFSLNNFHSYFLLVDDGTVCKYGCEINFRRRLERFLSRHKSEVFVNFDLQPEIMDVTIEEKITLQNYHTIPLVCLIIEGGTNTVQTVLVNVHDKPPVPVVVCDGSGRAADLLAFTHKYAYSGADGKISLDPNVQQQLISTISKTFDYSLTQAEYLFVQLINCVKKKDLISVFRLGNDQKQHQEIDLAILTASLKVIDLQLSKQLDIIMSWNRPDVAKKYLFLHGSESEKQVLEDKMFEALSQDKVEFVQLLLEYGVNLQKFLTFKRLSDLYNCKKGPTSTLIYIVRDVVKKMDANYKVTLCDIGLVIEKLIGNGYLSDYSKRDFRAKYSKLNDKKDFIISTSPSPLSAKESLFTQPFNELLIWAVLMKRHNMAMFVCKRGLETLAMALFAARLNKSLAREAEQDDLDSDICDEYKKYAEEFSALAFGLLDRCYKEDSELTQQLLTYDLANWSHWTCLSLAVACNHKDFLSHAACQLLINDLWMGGMKIRKNVTYKVVFALLFPPALFAIQFKTAKELQFMPQTQEEHEQDMADFNDSRSYAESEMNPKIGLALHGLNARSENLDLLEGEDPDSVDKILEYDQSNAIGNIKMLSLDQIIEFFDDHQANGTSRFALDDSRLAENACQTQIKRNQRKKLKLGKKIYEFYNAPITKFWQNTLMYVIFLVIFSYIVLIQTPVTPSALEIFVLVYIFTYGLDKCRELLQTDSSRFPDKCKIFFSKIMNTLDVVFILSMTVAFGFRLSPYKENHQVARILYCINTIYWYVKLLEFLIINKYTGLLIIIASRMLIDLVNFIIILLIVLMSFGLSRQAIKFPNEEFKWSLVKQIFLEPYFMLYGEVYAPDIDPPCNTTEDASTPGCQYGHWITPITMTIFMIIANLLFLSILIASFNNTYMRISRQSTQFWKCQRYHFVTFFEAKPLLAPPFVFLSHVYLIIKYFIRLCQRKKIKFDRKLKAFLSDEMVQRLNDFEQQCFYRYSCQLTKSRNDMSEEKISHTAAEVDSISSRIDDIFFKENLTKISLYNVEMRLQKLEELIVDKLGQPTLMTNQNNCMLLEKIHENKRNSSKELSNSGLISQFKSFKDLKRNQSNTNSSKQEAASKERINQNNEKASTKLDSSISSCSDNNDTKQIHPLNYNPTEMIQDSLKQIENIEPKMLCALEANIEDPASITEILNQIYETNFTDTLLTGFSNESQQVIQNLNSVIKPPITDYTSITDCIDTSAVDRPPSPPLVYSQHHPSRAKKFNNNLIDINKFRSGLPVYDTGLNPVIKQESEILRLAEERQHVIISQLVNKIMSFDVKDDEVSPINIIGKEFKKEVGLLDKSVRKTTLKEESEIECRKNYNGNFKQSEGTPLPAVDRKTNQDLYSQSQANAFCGNLMNSLEEEKL